MSTLAEALALAWWVAALALLAASMAASLAFPRGWRLRRPSGETPPVTAIAPIKALDAGFEAAQRSLFEQTYPQLEILIASVEADSEAMRAVERVRAQTPNADARIIVSPPREAASPKLGNLWDAIEQARSDVVLIKDSNVRLAPGDVARFVGHLAPEVGVVSAIVIVTEPRSAAAWVEASIINGHHVRVLMLARALGLGFGLGKITLFRRSDLERAGGLRSLAWALGEDEALTSAMARLGLRTVIADGLTYQSAGARDWRQVWNRFLRWKLVWRVQAPATFVGSLLGSALLAALAGAIAAPLLGLSPALVALATFCAWCALETGLCLARGWPVSLGAPLIFVAREVLDVLVWLRALTTSEVVWAGARYRSRAASRADLAPARGRP